MWYTGIVEAGITQTTRDLEIMSIADTLKRYIEHRGFCHFEGSTGVARLNEIIRVIDSHDYSESFGELILIFLENNPGATVAILNWIGEQNVTEWEEALDSELPEVEEEEDNSSGLATLNITLSDRQIEYLLNSISDLGNEDPDCLRLRLSIAEAIVASKGKS